MASGKFHGVIGRHHADRHAHGHAELVRQLARRVVAEQPAALPRHVVGGVDPLLDVAPRLGDDLAHLAGHQAAPAPPCAGPASRRPGRRSPPVAARGRAASSGRPRGPPSPRARRRRRRSAGRPRAAPRGRRGSGPRTSGPTRPAPTRPRCSSGRSSPSPTSCSGQCTASLQAERSGGDLRGHPGIQRLQHRVVLAGEVEYGRAWSRPGPAPGAPRPGPDSARRLAGSDRPPPPPAPRRAARSRGCRAPRHARRRNPGSLPELLHGLLLPPRPPERGHQVDPDVERGRLPPEDLPVLLDRLGGSPELREREAGVRVVDREPVRPDGARATEVLEAPRRGPPAASATPPGCSRRPRTAGRPPARAATAWGCRARSAPVARSACPA